MTDLRYSWAVAHSCYPHYKLHHSRRSSHPFSPPDDWNIHGHRYHNHYNGGIDSGGGSKKDKGKYKVHNPIKKGKMMIWYMDKIHDQVQQINLQN